MKPVRPILVTGSHKSGSTWVGRMLAASPQVAYIQEPFKPSSRRGVNPLPFPRWFWYLCPENEKGYPEAFERMFRFQFRLGPELRSVRHPRELVKSGRYLTRFTYHRLRGSRPLMKDPIALFSSEWLARHFDAKIIILIRHPAAFVSSLKIRGAGFDFRNLLDQPLLLRDYLGDFESAIGDMTRKPGDPLDQAALFWTCAYHVVDRFRRRHPDWFFLRHEDLSVDPESAFAELYPKLGLGFTPGVAETIRQYSGQHNPAETGERSAIRRNSRQNVRNWKKRLTAEEISRIRKWTEPVASRFYADEEW